MLGSADPRVEGRAVTVASLLDRAAARLDSLEDAEVRASLRLTLGQTYHGLGLLDEAERLLRRAVEERRALPGPHLRELAGATSALAGVLSERGEESQAEALFRTAIADCDAAGAGDSEEALAARAGLASTVQALGRLDEAEALQRDVLQRQTRALGPNHEAVAATLNNLGVVLGQRGAWAEAERLHRRALELVRSLKGERSPETASALATVATAVEAGGNRKPPRPSPARRSRCAASCSGPSTRTRCAPSTRSRTCCAPAGSPGRPRRCAARHWPCEAVSCPTPTRWWQDCCKCSA